jgi:hypothetical protein
MTRDLPGLDAPTAVCKQCGCLLTFDSPPWCSECQSHDDEMQLLEQRIHMEETFQAVMGGVRKRARTWQLGKAVQS